MSAALWDPNVIWDGIKNAGMLKQAYVAGSAEPIDVGFARPDSLRFGGAAMTTDWLMEYRAADLPDDPPEGTDVVIDGAAYRTRALSFVSDEPMDSDGFFRMVFLTKV
jgi:hypothetical protein